MNFFSWRTDYEAYRAYAGRAAATYTDFYPSRLDELKRYGMWPVRLAAEHYWQLDGKPYYNIHPQPVSKLAKVNLEKIPAQLIQMPHEFKCVHLRFAQSHEELTVREDVTTTKFGSIAGGVPKDSFVHGILMVDFRSGVPFQGMGGPIKGATTVVPQIVFIFDFNVYQSIAGQLQPHYGIFPLFCEEGENLLQALKRASQLNSQQCESYDAICLNALKLAVTIGFLANSKSELIEYDVLSKFSREFATADESRKLTLIDKSRKRGKIGYNVGNDLMFLGPQPSGGSSSAAGERELNYAHIRTGHPHAVRYGPGHSLVKVMWFSPTVVRPDLPFKG